MDMEDEYLTLVKEEHTWLVNDLRHVMMGNGPKYVLHALVSCTKIYEDLDNSITVFS